MTFVFIPARMTEDNKLSLYLHVTNYFGYSRAWHISIAHAKADLARTARPLPVYCSQCFAWLGLSRFCSEQLLYNLQRTLGKMASPRTPG